MIEVNKSTCAAAHVRKSDLIFLDRRAIYFVTIRLIGLAAPVEKNGFATCEAVVSAFGVEELLAAIRRPFQGKVPSAFNPGQAHN
jgi:hypothetical protein